MASDSVTLVTLSLAMHVIIDDLGGLTWTHGLRGVDMGCSIPFRAPAAISNQPRLKVYTPVREEEQLIHRQYTHTDNKHRQ